MTKYIGAITLILGISSSFLIELENTKIQEVLNDHRLTEILKSESNLSYLKHYKNKNSRSDSIAKSLIQLYSEIQVEKSSSNSESTKLIDLLLENKIDYNKNLSNLSLANLLCVKILNKEKTKLEMQDYYLVLDEFRITHNKDSIALKLIPIFYAKEQNVTKFYNRNKQITFTDLRRFKGDLNDLSARIINPITGEEYLVK